MTVPDGWTLMPGYDVSTPPGMYEAKLVHRSGVRVFDFARTAECAVERAIKLAQAWDEKHGSAPGDAGSR